jgi:XapX domain-containing protein
MSWQPYALSLVAGVGVGILYGLITVRSPAPPIIALLGLLGMLAGEAAVQWLKGHPNVLSHALHLKSFSLATKRDDETPPST